MMNLFNICDTAILVGFNPEGDCVYSEKMELADYYDREHIWDTDSGVKKYRIRRIHGFLFGAEGILEQEFESIFNLETGVYEQGRARFSDGTLREDKPRM